MAPLSRLGEETGSMARMNVLGRLVFSLTAIIALTTPAHPQPPADAPPRVFQSDGRDLVAVKRRLAAGDAQLAAALAELRQYADRELKVELLTVVHKPKAPPSGDK